MPSPSTDKNSGSCALLSVCVWLPGSMANPIPHVETRTQGLEIRTRQQLSHVVLFEGFVGFASVEAISSTAC
jgi:hypothetical protein